LFDASQRLRVGSRNGNKKLFAAHWAPTFARWHEAGCVVWTAAPMIWPPPPAPSMFRRINTTDGWSSGSSRLSARLTPVMDRARCLKEFMLDLLSQSL
jgi:hypothetical protein